MTNTTKIKPTTVTAPGGYTIELKPVSKGTKTSVRVLLNGEEIGSRTSARPYRFALVVKRRQSAELAHAQRSIEYQQKQVAKYASALSGGAATQRWIDYDDNGKPNTEWTRKCHQKFLAEGEVQKWIEGCQRDIQRLTAEVARLSSGPQPEFDKAFIASWHMTRRNVPEAKPYQVFVTVLEIPE